MNKRPTSKNPFKKLQAKFKGLTKKQKTRASIIAGILAVLLLIGAFVYSQTRKKDEAENKYQTVTLKKADPLTFKGIVKASTTQDYYFDQSLGKISTINVSDGQKVDDKTALLTYENPEVQSQADEQNENLNKLNVGVKNAQETVDAANTKQAKVQQQVTNAQNEYNAITGTDEESKAKKEAAKEKVDQTEEQLDAAKDAVLQARQALDQANAELSSANEAVNNMKAKVSSTVTSSSSGTAYVNQKGKNDPSVPVVQVVSDDVHVEGTVSEYDFSRLKENESVTVKPIISDQKIEGTITHINQLPEKSSSEQASGSKGAASVSNYTFTVKPAQSLQYGYNVQITLPLDEIRLPNAAVLDENGESYVFVYRNGTIHKKKVMTEKQDGYIVLRSGLKEKDKIVSNPDEKLSDGQKLAVD